MDTPNVDISRYELKIKRLKLFEDIVLENKDSTELKTEINKILSKLTDRYDETPEVSQKISTFICKLKSRWQESSRNRSRFLKRNQTWVSEEEVFPLKKLKEDNTVGIQGRPPLQFENLSESSKRRNTAEVRNEFSALELAYAAQMSLRSEGATDAAHVVRDVVFGTPTRASKYIKAFNESANGHSNSYTPDQALAIICDAKLTKNQYCLLRSSAKDHGSLLYPSYNRVVEAKKLCYPDGLTITETVGEVPLQNILDHTVKRLLCVQEEVVCRLTDQQVTNLQLISKWGYDSSAGHSQYKQLFFDPEANDASIMQTSFVPLQMFYQEGETKIIVWQNYRPSSTRLCRPIRIAFKKETEDEIKREHNNIERQVKELNVSRSNVLNREVVVKHNLLFTMIDGKICNALTSNSSSQRCYICHASPKEMNNLDLVSSKSVNDSALSFGLSTLHAWIRFFEHLLHLSYKLDVQTWAVKDEAHKEIVKQRKKKIQTEFKRELALNVDVPKQGFGNSNDGNTARTFFSKSAVSSRITGIDEALIKRYHTILQTLSSGLDINSHKFKAYAFETARLYVNLYGWYPMPVTVHKILIHSSEVIDRAILPIEQLSEDALECQHKEVKKCRESFSRKMSRDKTMTDIFHHILVSSDSMISNMRQKPTRKRKTLYKEAIALLNVSSPSSCDDGNDNDDSDISDDSTVEN